MRTIKEEILASFGKQWKVFLLSMAVQFVISSLLYFGIRSPKVLDFLMLPSLASQTMQLVVPASKADVFTTVVKPKLEQKNSSFSIKGGGAVNSVFAASNFDQATSYGVFDLDSGQVLLDKDIKKRLPVASLTKIMTAVVALDLASPNEKFTVNQHDAGMEPTKIGVVPGERMSLEELLNASLLTSANDAAEVIKDGINSKYGADVFVRAMNDKASVLGLKDTHFTNPQGLDSGSPYSSARDLVVLSHYALANYPLIASIVKKDYQFLPANSDHKQFDLYNWNGLIGVYPGAYGVKIGNTDATGYATIVAAERKDPRNGIAHNLLAVILGAPGVLERDLWASQLLDLGFEKLGIPPVNSSESQLRSKYAAWKYWG